MTIPIEDTKEWSNQDRHLLLVAPSCPGLGLRASHEQRTNQDDAQRIHTAANQRQAVPSSQRALSRPGFPSFDVKL
jgi:hypothetical protein